MCIMCPVCDQPPSFTGQVNVAKFNEKPSLIECSHPCHSQEELNDAVLRMQNASIVTFL